MYTLRRINNGILDTSKAMPLKDNTSNNDSSFALNRNALQRTSTVIGNNKKWYGNSTTRDSSSIVRSKHLQSAMSTMNSNKSKMAFTNIGDSNTQRQALGRVRNSGFTVPPKTTFKNMNTSVF